MGEGSITSDQFVELVRKSRLVDETRLDAYLRDFAGPRPTLGRALAELFVRNGFLTPFQAHQLLAGKWKGFLISDGKYKLLELLGVGGMGKVFLCEHLRMRRLVALKVLPIQRTNDPYALERFNREARAAAALDHPNIVRAHDIDQDGNLHFLVMEYVDGSSLQEIVRKHGPLEIDRACHYVAQAAAGLQHAHEHGLVHRDVKPGNLLLDRAGVLKVLDMGLARFSTADAPLTQKYDRNAILGTADYLPPEQADNSSGVTITADIYSLGVTFYYLLAGRTPYDGTTPTEKILKHREGKPDPLRTHRPNVPPALEAVVFKMMAKRAKDRYQLPFEVEEALRPWTNDAMPPPSEAEMPKLCPALETYILPGTNVPLTGLSGLLRVRAGRSGPQSSASQVRLASNVPAGPPPGPSRWAGWPAVAGALLFVLAGLIAGLAYDRYAGAGGQARVVAPARVPLPPPAADKLFVTRRAPGDRPDMFATLEAALKAVKPGQRVFILDGGVEARVRLADAKHLSGTSVESGLPAGQVVVWRAPAGGAADVPLLDLADPGAFTVKDIAFDGEQRADTLVRVTGDCGGLTLTDVELTDFGRTGLALLDAAADRPVALNQVRCVAARDDSGPARPALLDVAAARPVTVQVRNGRFEGPTAAAVRLAGPVEADISGGRFLGTGDGAAVRVAGFPASRPMTVTVDRCTAARLATLVDVTGLTPGPHRIAVRNSVMASGRAWLRADPAADAAALKRLVAGGGNVCRPGTCEDGPAVVPHVVADFPPLDERPGDDRMFLRYPRRLADGDHPLLKLGQTGGPAGTPQGP